MARDMAAGARTARRRASRRARSKTKRARHARQAIEAPAPVVEKSERAKRERRSRCSSAEGRRIAAAHLLDDPPAREGLLEEALEAMSRQIEFKLKDFRIEVEVVAPTRAR